MGAEEERRNAGQALLQQPLQRELVRSHLVTTHCH
jgi:hypothetical protein